MLKFCGGFLNIVSEWLILLKKIMIMTEGKILFMKVSLSQNFNSINSFQIRLIYLYLLIQSNFLGIDYGEKAISLDPENYNTHKWYAILVGMRNEFQGKFQLIRSFAHYDIRVFLSISYLINLNNIFL